jgi:hypothetical protein
MRRDTTRIRCLAGLMLAAAACGASDAEVRLARTSGFQTDFAIVYSETLVATRDLYPSVSEDARTGIIRTAWHPIKLGSGNMDDPTAAQSAMAVPGSNPQGSQSLQTSSATRDMYFIRFVVYVVGGRPWRVRVEGEASLWRAGEVPTPLHGADTPPWLSAREDALRLAVYRRLERYAVPLRFASSEDRAKPAAVDRTRFKGLPPEAVKVLTAVGAAALARDAATLRTHMADAFTWSLGSEPSADVAIATWQADPDLLAQLARAVEGVCARGEGVGSAAREAIVCREQPSPQGARRAVFSRASGAWKLVSFLGDE